MLPCWIVNYASYALPCHLHDIIIVKRFTITMCLCVCLCVSVDDKQKASMCVFFVSINKPNRLCVGVSMKIGFACPLKSINEGPLFCIERPLPQNGFKLKPGLM